MTVHCCPLSVLPGTVSTCWSRPPRIRHASHLCCFLLPSWPVFLLCFTSSTCSLSSNHVLRVVSHLCKSCFSSFCLSFGDGEIPFVNCSLSPSFSLDSCGMQRVGATVARNDPKVNIATSQKRAKKKAKESASIYLIGTTFSATRLKTSWQLLSLFWGSFWTSGQMRPWLGRCVRAWSTTNCCCWGEPWFCSKRNHMA